MIVTQRVGYDSELIVASCDQCSTEWVSQDAAWISSASDGHRCPTEGEIKASRASIDYHDVTAL